MRKRTSRLVQLHVDCIFGQNRNAHPRMFSQNGISRKHTAASHCLGADGVLVGVPVGVVTLTPRGARPTTGLAMLVGTDTVAVDVWLPVSVGVTVTTPMDGGLVTGTTGRGVAVTVGVLGPDDAVAVGLFTVGVVVVV